MTLKSQYISFIKKETCTGIKPDLYLSGAWSTASEISLGPSNSRQPSTASSRARHKAIIGPLWIEDTVILICKCESKSCCWRPIGFIEPAIVWILSSINYCIILQLQIIIVAERYNKKVSQICQGRNSTTISPVVDLAIF